MQSLNMLSVKQTHNLVMQNPHLCSLGNVMTGQVPYASTRGAFYIFHFSAFVTLCCTNISCRMQHVSLR